MFDLYLLGAVSAMIAVWVFKRIIGRGTMQLPLYIEMPSYRLPNARPVIIVVWDTCKVFPWRMAGVIMVVTIVLWGLLDLPAPSEDAMTAVGVDVGDEAAATVYTLDDSYAVVIGWVVSPVSDPFDFD